MATAGSIDTWREESRFSVQQIESTIGRDHTFYICCNDKIFVVALRPIASSGDQVTSILSRYNDAIAIENLEEEDKVQEEIENLIYESGWLKVVQENSPAQNCPFHLTISDKINLPKFSARSILVLERFHGIGYIAKVSVNGQNLCCKVGTLKYGKAVQREYEILQMIALSKYANSIRVPKLIALVVDNDDVIGILEELIPSKCTLGKMIETAGAIDSERRSKWAHQIEQTVHQLHEIGVVWGDGKTENILLNDESDDVYLIDFGGSFTDGWVDAKLMETIEGDNQALRRISLGLNTEINT